MQWFDGVALANDLILGLDVGTSSVKALFINVADGMLNRVEVKNATTTSQNLFAEQCADEFLAALAESSKSNSNLIADVIAIGLSGHTPSVLCVDSAVSAVSAERLIMTC